MRSAIRRRMAPILFLLATVASLPAAALEFITEEDVVKGIVTEDQLIRVADNVIILFDTSTSMNRKFRDTGMSKLEIAESEFKRRAGYFPEIGHTFALYEYTPWKELYPPQEFERSAFQEALGQLPERGTGSTPLRTGLQKAEALIEEMTGRTALFVFYDGRYTGRNPDPAIWKLLTNHDVCMAIVSSASDRQNEEMQAGLSKLSGCSRVIPFEDFVDRPAYTTGLLFDVKATNRIVTATEQRIVGLDVNNLIFEFDEAELTREDRRELDELGRFMAERPETYAVLAGYTDNVGIPAYNEHLSQMRTEAVAEYLTTEHGISPSRMVLHWYGERNPVASNDTEEGRMKNRRVEVVIGGV